jgi:hypothetical protein
MGHGGLLAEGKKETRLHFENQQVLCKGCIVDKPGSACVSTCGRLFTEQMN